MSENLLQKWCQKALFYKTNPIEAHTIEQLQIQFTDTVYSHICYSYTMVLGIYGSKPTKHEGGARGRGVVYVAINP